MAASPRFVFALLLPLLTSAPALAQSDWAGKIVITKKSGIKFGISDSKGKTVNLGELKNADYRVIKEQAGWLKVKENGVEGWFEKTDAVVLENAVDYFSGRIKANPNDAESFSRRGVAWRAKGDLDAAIKDYSEALRLSSKSAILWNNRALAFHDKREFDKALKDYDEAVRLDPKYAGAFFNRGNTWLSQEEFDKAIKDFTEAVRLEPKLVSAYYNRGNALSRKKDYDLAIKDYSEALKLDPQHVSAYINRGYVWWAKEDFDRAIKDYDEALKLDPKNTAITANRGLVLAAKSDQIRAAHIASANAALAKNDFDKAIKEYDEALGLDSKQVDAYYGRGMAWAGKKDFDQAISDYGEALRLDPMHANAHFGRGLAWEQKKEFAKAIKDHEMALELDPKYARAYNALAWLLATCSDDKIRDGKRAVTLATKACELSDWKKSNDLDTLAASCAEAGEFEDAVRHQTKALESAELRGPAGDAYRERLELYKQNKPYRQAP